MQASFVDALQPVHWPTFAIASARVAGVMMVAPLWSLAAIPARLRGAMAVVLTITMMPTLPHAVIPSDAPAMVVPMATELLLGVAIALSAAVFLHGIALAAEVVALQMGLSMGQALGVMGEIGTPGIGQAKGFLAISVFASVGGHVALMAAVGRSFHAIPPGGALALMDGGRAILALGGSVFTTAVRIGAPLIVALLLTNIALAILNRAVPQLNTMMVAVPITVGIGLVALGASLPLMVRVMGTWAGGTGTAADAVVEAFTPVPARP